MSLKVPYLVFWCLLIVMFLFRRGKIKCRFIFLTFLAFWHELWRSRSAVYGLSSPKQQWDFVPKEQLSFSDEIIPSLLSRHGELIFSVLFVSLLFSPFSIPSISCNTLSKNRIYLMLLLKMSTLESFLSGGYVGRSFLSSEKAMLTFCCRQRSRLVMANIFLSTPRVLVARMWFSMSVVEISKLGTEAAWYRGIPPVTLNLCVFEIFLAVALLSIAIKPQLSDSFSMIAYDVIAFL